MSPEIFNCDWCDDVACSERCAGALILRRVWLESTTVTRAGAREG